MNSPKLPIIIGSICGALLIQCTSSHNVLTDGKPGDGFVGTVDAADCTPTPETFTKLAEADLGPQANSASIAVAGYSSVVVYVTSSNSMCSYDVNAYFRADASSPFGGTGQTVRTPTNTTVNPGGRLRVDGTDLQLRNFFAGCSIHYVVAGVK